MPNESFPVGWTGPIDYQLMKDGEPYSIVGTSLSIVAKTEAGVGVNLTGDLSVLDGSKGIVRFKPSAGDFASTRNLLVRFKVTLPASGGDIFFPRGNPEWWVVRL